MSQPSLPKAGPSWARGHRRKSRPGAAPVYEFKPHHVTFNGADQSLASFKVTAPVTDSILDLATAPRLTD